MTKEQAEEGQASASKAGPVLVAVDFTPDAGAALVWAADYAERTGAPLHVLHVVHDPAEAPGHYRRDENDRLRPMEDVAKQMMAEFLEKAGRKRPELGAIQSAQPLFVTGIPATRILEAAEQQGARLIVMGSRGRTGLPHLLLGSKAERVAQLSPIPVTIVKSEAQND